MFSGFIGGCIEVQEQVWHASVFTRGTRSQCPAEGIQVHMIFCLSEICKVT